MAADDPAAVAIRCPGGDLQFKVIGGHTLEIKCGNRRCCGDDSVALHQYSITGEKVEYLRTLKFKDPFVRGRGARPSRKDPPQNGRITR